MFYCKKEQKNMERKNNYSSHNKLKDILNEEHSGFAVALEVLATLVMCCVFLCMILYILRVMNVQRYMNTVMTATAAQASRWGGVSTNAYKNNVSTEPLIVTGQNQLNIVARDFGATLYGTPSKIQNDGDKIKITIKYHLPPVFQTMSKVSSADGGQYDMYNKTKNMNMSVTVGSIMEAGKLL